MKFELSELHYDLNALEPYISKKTLEFHHTKHHQAYVSNLNSLIAKTKFMDMDLETIVRVADGPIFNYAAQIWNHTFYFEGLIPGNNKTLKGPFADVIKNNFGSVSFFKTFLSDQGYHYSEPGGSGWF